MLRRCRHQTSNQGTVNHVHKHSYLPSRAYNETDAGRCLSFIEAISKLNGSNRFNICAVVEGTCVPRCRHQSGIGSENIKWNLMFEQSSQGPLYHCQNISWWLDCGNLRLRLWRGWRPARQARLGHKTSFFGANNIMLASIIQTTPSPAPTRSGVHTCSHVRRRWKRWRRTCGPIMVGNLDTSDISTVPACKHQ